MGERWKFGSNSFAGQPIIYKEGENETYAIPVCIVTQRSFHPLESHAETDRLARIILHAPLMLDALERALVFINGHEVAHGRPFGTGNEVRDVIELATGVRPPIGVT